MDCPFCGDSCDAEYVDIGVGRQQVTPFTCSACGASEMGSYQTSEGATGIEMFLGWWQGSSVARPEAQANFQRYLDILDEKRLAKENVFSCEPAEYRWDPRE